MGSYAGLLSANSDGVSEKERDALAAGVEKIFREGGMMAYSGVKLFGKTIYLLKPFSAENGDIDVAYNYFENDFWENAGLNYKKGYVWSGKIGGSTFADVIMTAYFYESLLKEDFSAVEYDGWFKSQFVIGYQYVGWINHILHTNYECKFLDPWPLFEFMYQIAPTIDADKDYLKAKAEKYSWDRYSKYANIGTCGYLEIVAVLHQTEDAIECYAKLDKNTDCTPFTMDMITDIKRGIQVYRDSSPLPPETQIQELLQNAADYWSDMTKYQMKDVKDDSIKELMVSIIICDMPAFFVKAVSEVYQTDFWGLWAKVRDVAKRNKLFYSYIPECTIEKTLGITADDRIPYWTSETPITFSDNLEQWFSFLREEWQRIVSSDPEMLHMADVVQMLSESQTEYGNVFAFERFFAESVERLLDTKYTAMWYLYRILYQNIDLQQKSCQILGLFEADEQVNESNQKKNIQRILRYFHALAGNLDLRNRVLGF